jgi:hypothetical protein
VMLHPNHMWSKMDGSVLSSTRGCAAARALDTTSIQVGACLYPILYSRWELLVGYTSSEKEMSFPWKAWPTHQSHCDDLNKSNHMYVKLVEIHNMYMFVDDYHSNACYFDVKYRGCMHYKIIIRHTP